MNTNTIEGVTTDETDVDSIVPAVSDNDAEAEAEAKADTNKTSVYDGIIVSEDKSDKENIVILKKGIKDFQN